MYKFSLNIQTVQHNRNNYTNDLYLFTKNNLPHADDRLQYDQSQPHYITRRPLQFSASRQ